MLPSAVDQIKSGIKSPHTNQSTNFTSPRGVLGPLQMAAFNGFQHHTVFFPIVGISSKYGIDS